jgi:opacity protein-like surface antigen
MKNSFITIITIGLLVCNTLVAVTVSHADEIINHFSIGYGKLNQSVYNDPKAPVTKAMTLNYGFNGLGGVTPYVGTGLAITDYPDLKPGEKTKMNAGFTSKAGLMFELDKKTSLKFDYKYLSISPESARGENSSRPQSIGIGLDIKF